MTATSAAALRYAAVAVGSVVALAAAVLTPLGTAATLDEPPAYTQAVDSSIAVASAPLSTR
ncbi:hypothetical protein HT102_10080 [Hoyosella sp. G463]|uniref:Uncharacterized protein n=1 Tax=Lolliginicoccus lacisalsi TaxID=2742202 RepID=A0A927JDI6_9ACTN|nr:hypothetical protein [Lolliginicoccus lacisalsi]MBD8506835.1 hypothetical protein [Lolliginicoccus lacisalsi]